MYLTANDKTVELHFKTRLVQQFEERMKVENSQNFWVKAAQDENLKVIATALLVFSDKALHTLDDAYDFIDAYLEAGGTVSGLYLELVTGINEKGFFGQKMTPAEVQARLEAPLVDMAMLMDKVAGNMADQMVGQTPGRS